MIAVVGACLAVGGAVGWFAARARSATEIARLDATLRATREGEGQLEQSMRALSYEATAQSQEAVARAVAPLHETLRRYEQRVADLERERVDAYAELREQVRAMSASPVSCGRRRSSWWRPYVRRRCVGGGASTSCGASSRPPGCWNTATSPSRSPPPPTSRRYAPTWWFACTADEALWWTRRRRSTRTSPRWRRATSGPGRPSRRARQAPAGARRRIGRQVVLVRIRVHSGVRCALRAG